MHRKDCKRHHQTMNDAFSEGFPSPFCGPLSWELERAQLRFPLSMLETTTVAQALLPLLHYSRPWLPEKALRMNGGETTKGTVWPLFSAHFSHFPLHLERARKSPCWLKMISSEAWSFSVDCNMYRACFLGVLSHLVPHSRQAPKKITQRSL